jgi:ABC-type arginine transport system permease subunit
MVRSSWGRWLVNSSAMRTGYAVVKAVAFTLLALALGLQTGGHAAWYSVWTVASAASWVAVALCIVRGLPVLIEVRRLFYSAEFQVAAPSASHE